jgi:hypothetical protein
MWPVLCINGSGCLVFALRDDHFNEISSFYQAGNNNFLATPKGKSLAVNLYVKLTCIGTPTPILDLKLQEKERTVLHSHQIFTYASSLTARFHSRARASALTSPPSPLPAHPTRGNGPPQPALDAQIRHIYSDTQSISFPLRCRRSFRLARPERYQPMVPSQGFGGPNRHTRRCRVGRHGKGGGGIVHLLQFLWHKIIIRYGWGRSVIGAR